MFSFSSTNKKARANTAATRTRQQLNVGDSLEPQNLNLDKPPATLQSPEDEVNSLEQTEENTLQEAVVQEADRPSEMTLLKNPVTQG